MNMPVWASSGPALFIFLFFVVFFRAQSTYWLGRGSSQLTLYAAQHARSNGHSLYGRCLHGLARWFDGPIPQRGAHLLSKWGLIIIPLCFLTVGIQTAVNAGAGIVRLKWRTYTCAMIPGCIIWAFMYGLGLLALWTAIVEALAGNPWSWAAIFICLGCVFAGVKLRRRYLTHHKEASEKPIIIRSDSSTDF